MRYACFFSLSFLRERVDQPVGPEGAGVQGRDVDVARLSRPRPRPDIVQIFLSGRVRSAHSRCQGVQERANAGPPHRPPTGVTGRRCMQSKMLGACTSQNRDRVSSRRPSATQVSWSDGLRNEDEAMNNAGRC